jgi:hypothetical protein
MVEVLGYVASAVIILSLTMTSIVRLRVVGLAGSALFATYGALVGSIPVVATNMVIFGLHVFFLWRAFNVDEFFTLLEVRPESRYLSEFLEYHRSDICRFQPGFAFAPTAEHLTLFILRDMVPAGLLIGRQSSGGTLDVQLDYVIPRFRDLKVADFLFRANGAAFRRHGISRLVARVETQAHGRYLRRVGFAGREGDMVEMVLA